MLRDIFTTWRPISYEAVKTKIYYEGVIADAYPDHMQRSRVILNMSCRVRKAFDLLYPGTPLHELQQSFGMLSIEDLIPLINMAIDLPKEQCDDRDVEI